ncbi:MAG: sulfur carrier protein ThiS [Planctomycetota bacterium]|jgi:sulfur carrier protein
MKIVVNGQEHEFTEGSSIADVVAALDIKTDRIATEHNLSVVPKAQYAATKLNEGDRLEIVSFVGGG